MHNIPSETPPPAPPVSPFVPERPQDPNAPDPSPETPAPPVTEPSIDTTKRQAPGPQSPGPVKVEAPKLPHERDQSVDMTQDTPHPEMKQAYSDLQRGLQDTGRGPPSDAAYKKL